MKVSIISGSRADRGALEATRAALVKRDDMTVTFTTNLEHLSDPSPADRAEVANIAAEAVTFVTHLIEPADLVVVVGDRYEILAATMGAYLLGKPIAHLSGGDITEGSQDDSMRHAITKLSHLHFVTNDESRARVIQMGEEPWRVHVTGCPAIDTLPTEPQPEHLIKESIGLKPDKTPFIVVVWHPHTLNDRDAGHIALASALMQLRDTEVVIIGPNNDHGNRQIRETFKRAADRCPNIVYHDTLPRWQYLYLLHHCAALVGNSSSGMYEAPSFSVPVINIGDRQRGRLKAANIIDCDVRAPAIVYCIEAVLAAGRPKHKIINLYGDGKSAERIADIICSIKDPTALLRKKFNDLRQNMGENSLEPTMGEVSFRTTGSICNEELRDGATEGPERDLFSGPGLWPGGGYTFPGA